MHTELLKNRQPWIGKPVTEIFFILLPPFVSLLVVLLLPAWFQNNSHMPETGWVILVLLIDVAHVYTTLYRTYFDKAALQRQRSLLLSVPFIGFVSGVLLYSVSSLLFWRILAYVAVFHFVRQQYGFMRVYSRYESRQGWQAILDKVVIYAAALYPMLYWHCSGPRNFNWFIEGDFLFFAAPVVVQLSSVLYFFLLLLFVCKEIASLIKTRRTNLPKLGVISGTAVSWYFGIVYFNGDMAFTLLNVVSHGIPYMALVWLHGEKQARKKEGGSRLLNLVFSRFGSVVFLLLVFLFAFIEEGLWDVAVWQEHKSVFGTGALPSFSFSHQVLSFIVPLLALPQVTHYILDGFIWKIRKDDFRWRSEAKAG